MKPTKHILLLAALLLGSLAASAHDFEVGGICYNITSEEDLTVAVTYRGNSYNEYSNEYSGAVTIPSTVTYNSKTYSVTSIGYDAFYDCSSLTDITIPEGVTSIGEGAFLGCSSLTSITLPESVTSIGGGAFLGCSSFTAVHISSLEAWCNIDFEDSFANPLYYAKSLYISGELVTELTIPNSVTAIKRCAFQGCSSLTSITLPKSVTSIGYYAFCGCSSLTAITIPEGVTSIGSGVFSGCSSLTAITIPAGVTSIGVRAFKGCSSLTSITIPESVTSIGYDAFYDCSSLTDIYCCAKNVPETGSDIFYNVTNATLHVPESALAYYKSTAPWSDFNQIVALLEVYGYLYHADSKRFLSRGEHWGTCATVDKYGIPFVWTGEVYSLKFLDSNACLFETADGYLYTDNKSTGFTFEAVEGGFLLMSQKSGRYLTIEKAAYSNDIVNVTDDASTAVVWQLKSKAEHDAIVAGYVEENYKNVIEASGINTTVGEFTDYLATFITEDKTSAIATARFDGSAGGWIYTKVHHYDNQPRYGTDFCEIWQATGSYKQTITNLPEGIYKVTMQGFERAGSWRKCDTLGKQGYEITTATLSANGEEVNLKSWYSDKSSDNNLNTIDQAVEKLNEGKYMNEVYTYVGTDGTLTITVNKPSRVSDNWVVFNNFTLTRYQEGWLFDETTGHLIIGKNYNDSDKYPWHEYRDNIKSLEIRTGVTSIGDRAFEDCSSLTAITIPESVTSIGDYAFLRCSNLSSIYIPEGVSNIGNFAFSLCNSLSSIDLPESLRSIGDGIFSYCGNLTSIVVAEENAIYDSRENSNVIIETSSSTLVAGCSTSVIPESVTTIANYAFVGLGFNSITIPQGVKSIRDYAFQYCNNLTSIVVDENNIVYDSRNSCNAIIETNSNTLVVGCSTTVIPESVSAIGINAFCGCGSLTSITIPENVTCIGNWAFANCFNLSSITCEATMPPTIGVSSTFYGVDMYIPVYVPAGCVGAYQASEGWSEFTNILPIEEPTPDYVAITISKYGSGTYSSAYALDFSEVQGLKAYVATGYNYHTGVVTLLRVHTADAATGLLVKGTPGASYEVPVMEYTADRTLNMMVATLERTEVDSRSSDGVYANYKYTVDPAQNPDEPLFYPFADNSHLSAGKAYLQIPVAWLPATGQKSIRYRFDEGETTDIEDEEIINHKSGIIYDLYGRRVVSPKKGEIYIINNQKVVYLGQ